MRISLILLLLFLSALVHARRIDGLIIKKDDTLKVTFDVPVGTLSNNVRTEKIQYGIRYYVDYENKVFIDPGSVQAIVFKHNGESYMMESMKNIFDKHGSFIFLRKEIDGQLMMFSYHSSTMFPLPGGGFDYLPTVEYVLKKRGGEIKRTSGNFRKDMITYFEDCPSLAELIRTRKFKYDDVPAIVTYYNIKCIH